MILSLVKSGKKRRKRMAEAKSQAFRGVKEEDEGEMTTRAPRPARVGRAFRVVMARGIIIRFRRYPWSRKVKRVASPGGKERPR